MGNEGKTSFSEGGIYEYRVAGCSSIPDDTDIAMFVNGAGGGWEAYSVCPIQPDDPYMKQAGIMNMKYAIFMKRIKGGG